MNVRINIYWECACASMCVLTAPRQYGEDAFVKDMDRSGKSYSLKKLRHMLHFFESNTCCVVRMEGVCAFCGGPCPVSCSIRARF